MAKPTWDQLVENVPRSRLVEPSQWEVLLHEWESSAESSQQQDVDAFLQFLVDKKAISAWHKDNLLTGKYKGYFLGAYKLLQHIGSGGMSSVYLAEHTMMGREVAIKILPRSRVSSETSYLKRFLQEAQAAAALNHPNIVTAYDIDNENGIYYLVMEYVNGEDLSALVKRGGPLEYGVAADYICQASEGLAHAHENNLIHRDMKPANLLVDKEGVVKILDMGLALFTESDRASLTLAYDENVLGTADYLAPEQARNSHTVDPRADIYGLGCTLYFLLTGHPPFTEGTLPQRILAHQKKEAPAITIDRPDCPPDLIAICKKMMAKKADNRQQSMLEVQENLTDWRLVHGFLPNNESLDNIVRSRNRLDALQKSLEAPETNNSGVLETGSFVNLDLRISDNPSSSHSGRSTSKSPIGRVSELRKKSDSSSNGKKKAGGLFGGLFGGKSKPKTESPSDSNKSNSSAKIGSASNNVASGKSGSSRSNSNKANTTSQTHLAPAEGSNAYNFLAESDPASSNAATRIDQKSLSAIVALADKLSDGSSTRNQNTPDNKTQISTPNPTPTTPATQNPPAANQGASPASRPATQKPQVANQGSSSVSRPATQKPQAANQGSSPASRPAAQKSPAANQGSSPASRPAAQKPQAANQGSSPASRPAAQKPPAANQGSSPASRPTAQKPQVANQGSSPASRPAAQNPQAAKTQNSPTTTQSGTIRQSGTISPQAIASKPAAENAPAPRSGKRPVRGKGQKVSSGMNKMTLIFIILAVVLFMAVGIVLFFVLLS